MIIGNLVPHRLAEAEFVIHTRPDGGYDIAVVLDGHYHVAKEHLEGLLALWKEHLHDFLIDPRVAPVVAESSGQDPWVTPDSTGAGMIADEQ